MIKVAFKSLAARRLRTALTALAIVLGVAMVSGAFTITDTMRGAANSLSSAAYDGTDAVVGARTAFAVDAGDWTAKRPTVDASLLEQVRAVPGVAVAAADITDEAKIIKRDGKPAGDGPVLRRRLRRPHAGRRAPDAVPARQRPLGDRARARSCSTRPPPRTRTTASARPCRSRRAARRTTSRSSAPRASAASSRSAPRRPPCSTCARRRSCSIAATRSTGSWWPAATACRRRSCAPTWRGALPDAQVVTAAKQDRFTLDGLEQFISIIRIALLVFGGVAILVGAFTIFNTLSITVAQRTRELGLLRMVGAHRRQVLGSVLAEALAIGVLASVIGLAAGLGLAKALDALFDSMGLALPEAGTVFAARTIVVALLVGTLVTLVAGLLPAWRATRVAPVEALRAATPGAGRVRLPSRAVRAMASLLGRPAQAVGGAAGGLARRNAMRQPGRTMTTATALTIGVALVTLVTVVARGPEGHDARGARAAHRREPRDHRRGRLVGDRARGRARARERRRRDRDPPGSRARVRRQGDRQRDRPGDQPGPALVRLGRGRRQRPGAARRRRRDRRRGLGVRAPARRRRRVRARSPPTAPSST